MQKQKKKICFTLLCLIIPSIILIVVVIFNVIAKTFSDVNRWVLIYIILN